MLSLLVALSALSISLLQTSTLGTPADVSALSVGAPNLVRLEFCRRCYYVDHAPPRPPPVTAGLPCVHLGPVL